MPTTQLRIALTIPSAASLGAYEAGAAAGLVVALQRLAQRAAAEGRRPAAVLDAVGATSAGALVGLLAARCLLAGLDPVHVLHRAWVDEASWRRLRRGAGDAPLTLDGVERGVGRLLDPRDRRGRPAHRVPSGQQRTPIVLHVGLGTLQALAFPLDGLGSTVAGLTHVDATRFVLGPDDGVAAWTQPARRSPLDVALAAMAHPAVFAPRLLDRRGETERYEAAGVTNLPRSGHLWYGDGGALVRNPLGGTLAAARHADERQDPGGAVTRMHVLVQPHTAGPDDSGEWTDPERRPAWPSALSRALASLGPEALYADHRRVEDVNARLELAERLCDMLAPLLPAEAGPAISAVLDGARDHGDAGEGGGEGGELGDVLRRALADVGDLAGKTAVATEVVSPLRLLDEQDAPVRLTGGATEATGAQPLVPRLLAGEFLGRFGGLLDRDVRHSDFVTGWRSTRVWFPDALSRYGVADGDVAAAVEAVDGRGVEYGRSGFRGGTSLGDLPLHARARLAGTLVHAARVAVGATLRSSRAARS